MKRVAMIMPGGVAQPDKGLHIPSLYHLIAKLSHCFEITVYSLTTPAHQPTQSLCGEAVVKYIPSNFNDHGSIKLWNFLNTVAQDHLKRRFHILHGMLGLPSELATILLGKIFRIPTVLSFLGGETANVPHLRYGNLRGRPSTSLTLWIAQQANCLTLQSQYQLSLLQQHKLERTDIEIIPHGIETSLFKPMPKPSAPPFNFISVANIHKLKDHTTLLKALAIVSKHFDCRLRMIGIDYLNGKIQELANDLGICDKVEFLGHVHYEEMPQHFQWAHIILHTSLYEGGSVAVTEAAASGVVIVGTKVGLLSDFSEDKAITIDIGDYQGLAEKIIELLHDEKQYLKLQKNSLGWAMEHDINWTVQRYATIYNKLLVSNSPEKQKI